MTLLWSSINMIINQRKWLYDYHSGGIIIIRDGSKFIGYLSRDHRQGGKLFFREKRGDRHFSTKGGEGFFFKKIKGWGKDCISTKKRVKKNFFRQIFPRTRPRYPVNFDRSLVIFFLFQGSSISMTTRDGFTPLHTAVKYGHHIVVQYLLGMGAGINDLGGQVRSHFL